MSSLSTKKIALIEPFCASSHERWLKGFCQYSQHEITPFTLSGRYWKWRMHGGAVSLAEEFLAHEGDFDYILVSDMLDLTTFLALTRAKTAHTPIGVYFHENQLTYPWSPSDQDVKLKRDNHYAFINFTTALAADQLFFNSQYHLDSFLQALPRFLQQFPDYKPLASIKKIEQKSQVLYLGMDLGALDAYRDRVGEQGFGDPPLILWNHRWEYDKNPEAFFQLLFRLTDNEVAFRLVVLGEHYRKQPAIFKKAKECLSEHIVHWGYAPDKTAYVKWLWKADLLPVTSNQDFFGGSIVEAIYCGTIPFLPHRLAYPEHIPSILQHKYLYKNEEQLYQKVKNWLNYPDRNDIPQLHAQMKRYNWGNCIRLYDRAFLGNE